MLLLSLFTSPLEAKNLVIVLLPGTSLADWQWADAPHLHQMMAGGAIAVMNTRTARLPSDHVRESPESAVLTLGAGARAAGGTEATDFLPANALSSDLGVTAGQLYTRRMGFAPPPLSLVNPQWPRVLRENTGLSYDLHLGNLAEVLRSAGVRVEAMGGPLAAVLATGGSGIVQASALPRSKDSCLIWDAGRDLAAADQRLGALMADPYTGQIIVLSPMAGDAAYAHGERLCPIVVWGPGIAPGLLYSPSTRRVGLVTNTDFAPSVAAYFNVPLSMFHVRPFGAAWDYRPMSTAVSKVDQLDRIAVRQWQGMHLLPYAALLLGAWMLGATLVAGVRAVPPGVGSVPPAMILALIISPSEWSLAFWLPAFAAMLFMMRPFARRIPILFAGLIAVLLVSDMALGDPLMRVGLLGYSAIEGARYYGIGNEAMGALIGACLITADTLYRQIRPERRIWLWIGLALVTALLGSPTAGAKAGGLIVALAAFGSYGWLRSGRRLGWLSVGCSALGIAAVLIGVAALDAHLGASRASHFGQAVGRLTSGGPGEWGDIIRRKLTVEGRLLYHSAWACPLWGGLVSFLWLARRRGLTVDKPLLISGLVAVGTCLAVNDAGTVAGALCLTLLWSRYASRAAEKSPAQAIVMA